MASHHAGIIPLVLLLFGFLRACAGPSTDQDDGTLQLAITGVNVLPMTGDTVLNGYTVLIEASRIRSLYQGEPRDLPNGTRVIDAEGAFLIPGLTDAHVHLESDAVKAVVSPGDSSSLLFRRLLFPYLANGVTSVWVLSGSPDLLRVRDSIARGQLLGPAMVVASPMLDGHPPILPEPMTRVVTNGTQGTAAVAEFADAGYDLVKIRTGLSADAFRAVATEARVHGLRSIGHVPRQVPFEELLTLSSGFGIAHLEDIRITGAPNSAALDQLADLLRAHSTYVITTLTVYESLLEQARDYEMAYGSPETAVVHPLVRHSFWRNNPFREPGSQARIQYLEGELRDRQMLARELWRRGVPIIVGTDALNPLIVPGFSVHRELRLLRQAGLRAYEVLSMATSVPHLLRRSNGGIIAAGAAADMLLIDGNPLEDLGALRNVRGVVVHGQWIPRATIEATLDSLRAEYQ